MVLKWNNRKSNEQLDYFALLFKCAGSVWHQILMDCLVFLCFRWIIGCLYRFVLIRDDFFFDNFNYFLDYMKDLNAVVPLSFLAGFFVTKVLVRWFDFVNIFPKYMEIAVYICGAINTNKKQSKPLYFEVRRTFMRYLHLAWILHFTALSQEIRARFDRESIETKWYNPNVMKKKFNVKETLRRINDDNEVKRYFGQLITKEEQEILCLFVEDEERRIVLPFLPLKWCLYLLRNCVKQKLIRNSTGVIGIINLLSDFQNNLIEIYERHKYNIPLVYNQCILFLVYLYALSQLLNIKKVAKMDQDKIYHVTLDDILNIFLPINILFQLILYLGWFKIGLSLTNPLQEDMSHFPTSFILNFRLRESILMITKNDYSVPKSLNFENNQEFCNDLIDKEFTDMSFMPKDLWCPGFDPPKDFTVEKDQSLEENKVKSEDPNKFYSLYHNMNPLKWIKYMRINVSKRYH